jgi:hypothetical protein
LVLEEEGASFFVTRKQGDKIGRFFEQRVNVYFGQFLFSEVAQNFGLCLFFLGNLDYIVLTKVGWATFWAIFSQTHLVTLLERPQNKHTLWSASFFDV